MNPNIPSISTWLRFCSGLRFAMHLKFFIFLLIFSLSTHLIGQPPVVIPVSIIGINEGMANLGNYFCFKDSRDFIWISSYSGLHQFDGKNMKVFQPILNDTTSIMGKEVVSYIVEDGDNNIWSGNEKALSCYVRRSGEFRNFTIQDGSIDEYRVQGIDGKGDIWVTFDGQIYSFNPGSKKFISKARISLNERKGEAVLMTEFQLDDNKNVSWTFSYGSYLDDPGLEIHKFSGDSVIDQQIYFDDSDGLMLTIHDVHFVKDNILLIASREGVFEFDLNIRSILPILPESDYGGSGCSAIVSFSDSTILFAMRSAEYIEYNYDRKHITEKFVLSHDGKQLNSEPEFTNLDKNGGIYIHLKGNGLAYFHPKNLLFRHRQYLQPHSNDGETMSIGSCLVEADGGRVIATSRQSGILIFTEKGILLDAIDPDGPEGRRIPNNEFNSCMKDTKGRIWFFHYSRHLTKIDGLDSGPVISYSIDSMFWKGIEMPSGKMLLMARKGLFIGDFDKPGKPDIELIKNLDPTRQYTGITMHSNGLIISGEYKKSIMTIDPSGDFEIVSQVNFPYALNMSQSIKDSDDFLVPSFFGPYYYNATTDSVSLLDYCKCGNTADIYRFTPIGDDRYFSSSDNGVCTIDLSNQTSTHYGLEHGLGLISFNRGSMLQHSNGTIWMGNDSGITICDPNHLEKTEFGNHVNITGILINANPLDQTILKKGMIKNIHEIQDLELNYKFNTVSFQFAAFSYAGINHHEYEHRMLGLEEGWVDGGDRGFARYSNLPSGNFTFETRVKDQPESLRAVIININPPLWGRTWFQLLLILSTLGILYYAFLTRERRKQHIQKLIFERRIVLEQERVRIATDMHDDVGSGLSALNMRAQLLAGREKEGEMKKQLNLLAQNSRQLTQKIREIIWTVNAENDTIENLITRLHQYALEFFENTDIFCNVEIMEEQNDKQIEGHHRRDIYLTFKEVLNNIYKHAEANEVDIKIDMPELGQLNISISDNGKGFDISTISSGGNGLRSMRNRIEGMGGELEIRSGEEGTTLLISTPI